MHGLGTLWSSASSSSSGAIALAGAMVAIGLVLWLGGHRVVRGALVLLGVLLGAAAGVLAFQYVSADGLASGIASAGGSSPWIALLVGSVLGGVFGYISHRPLIAGLSALIIGAASVGIAVAAFNINLTMPSAARADRPSELAAPAGPSIMSASARSPADETLDAETRAALARFASGAEMREDTSASMQQSVQALARSAGALAERSTAKLDSGRADRSWSSRASLPESLQGIAAPALAQARDASASFRSSWNDLPTPARSVLTIAMSVGLAAGLLLGVLWIRLASGLVTASLGAAAWLVGAGVLTAAIAPSFAQALDQPAWMLLTTWAGAALVGTAWQWRMIAKRGPASAPKSA